MSVALVLLLATAIACSTSSGAEPRATATLQQFRQALVKEDTDYAALEGLAEKRATGMLSGLTRNRFAMRVYTLFFIDSIMHNLVRTVATRDAVVYIGWVTRKEMLQAGELLAKAPALSPDEQRRMTTLLLSDVEFPEPSLSYMTVGKATVIADPLVYRDQERDTWRVKIGFATPLLKGVMSAERQRAVDARLKGMDAAVLTKAYINDSTAHQAQVSDTLHALR